MNLLLHAVICGNSSFFIILGAKSFCTFKIRYRTFSRYCGNLILFTLTRKYCLLWLIFTKINVQQRFEHCYTELTESGSKYAKYGQYTFTPQVNFGSHCTEFHESHIAQ